MAIHEFIRDRICTWQPELLVIKTPRSPFALSSIARQSKRERFPGTVLVLGVVAAATVIVVVVVVSANNVRGGGDTRGQLYRRFRRNT